MKMRLIRAESVYGDTIDVDKFNASIKRIGIDDWPGKACAIDEIDCHWSGVLEREEAVNQDDDTLAGYLLMVRSMDHDDIEEFAVGTAKFK